MAKTFAKAFYASKDWQACRSAFITSVFGLCQRCKQPGHIVHHKILLTPDNIADPDVTLSWDNLQYLCLECHNTIHGENNPLRDDVRFTPDGQLVPIVPPCRVRAPSQI